MYEFASEAKERDWKRGNPSKNSDKGDHTIHGEPQINLGHLWDMAHNIRRNDDRLSINSMGKKLSLMPAAERASSLLSLQRTYGNRYVQGLVAQAKLRVGQAGDSYEQEADLVANRIMKMPGPNLQRHFGPEGIEQAKEHAKPLASQITVLAPGRMGSEGLSQTKEADGTVHGVNSGPEEQMLPMRGGGQPLPDSVRNFFEPRFGYDFSHVMVHTDARAAESARSINALAYTVGSDVVFDSGQYSPTMTSGRQLMAHELTHVVQQGGSHRTIQKQKGPSSPAGGRRAAGGASQPAFHIVIVEVSMMGLADTIREKIRNRILNELKQITAASKKPKIRLGFDVSFRKSLTSSEAKAFGTSDFIVYMVRKDNPQQALDLAKRHVAIEKKDENSVLSKLTAQLKAEGGACVISGKQKVCFVDVDLFERLSRGIFSDEDRTMMDEKMGEHLGELMLHELGHAMGQTEGKGLMGKIIIELNRPTNPTHFTGKSKGEVRKTLEAL